MACREGREQTLRCAQLSARLSVELCSPGLWHYYTTLRCTESEHFLWPLSRKFQDSWWDPEFPQLSQMVQSLPGFLNLCLNVCSPSQVLGDVYTEVLEATHPLHRGPTDHKRSHKSGSVYFACCSHRDPVPVNQGIGASVIIEVCLIWSRWMILGNWPNKMGIGLFLVPYWKAPVAIQLTSILQLIQ